MNSFELNKILGAVLACCLFLLALNIGASAIFSPEKPAKPGYAIAVKDHGGGEKAAPAEAAQPIEVLLASASSEKGQATAKQCAACHTFEKGGPSRVGPNLWGIVGRPKAAIAGFNYSAGLKAKGGTWTFDELSHFIANPRGFISGTSMAFAGLSRDSQRADVIEFLRKQADSPLPLPKVAAGGAKPAEAPKAGAPAAAPAAKH